MTENFKVAPYGATAWVWTISFILGLIFFGARTVLAFSGGAVPDPFDAGATIILLALIVYAWLRSVRGYTLSESELTVLRAGPGRLHIPVADIVGVKADPDLGTFFNVSFLSVGGVFGWAGRVRVRKPTDMNSTDAIAYGTNPANTLLLELKNGRKVILTPKDTHAMETALRLAGVGSAAAPAARKPSPSRAGKKR